MAIVDDRDLARCRFGRAHHDEHRSGQHGWNYNGLPASTVLHWFPQFRAGTYTGQSQAAWSLAGNSSYVTFGGEFPGLNGINQQGVTRMAVRNLARTNAGRPTPPSRHVRSRPRRRHAPDRERSR
jgi:hypothetical protein